MPVSGMNHFTVVTKDLDATKAFYMELLGLTEGFRPDLGFPGAWLYVDNQAILHIVAGRGVPANPASNTSCAGCPRPAPGSSSASIRMAPASSSISTPTKPLRESPTNGPSTASRPPVAVVIKIR